MYQLAYSILIGSSVPKFRKQEYGLQFLKSCCLAEIPVRYACICNIKTIFETNKIICRIALINKDIRYISLK